MSTDILKKHIFLIFIIILPILCFITRKISKPLYSNPLQVLNDKSFFGKVELKYSSEEELINMRENNNTRLFIKATHDSIFLYFTFSKYKYYDDYSKSFMINLKINKSSLTYNDNNSILYSDYFEINSKIIKIRENRIFHFYSKNIDFPLNNISFLYIKNYGSFICTLFFDDFNLTLDLKKEVFTYKFYYLILCIIDILILCFIFNTDFWKYNFQNIYELFTYIIWSKVTLINFTHIYELFQISFPLLKLINFYPHLLIYGEIILSISDIFSITLIVSYILISIPFTFFKIEIEKNYLYCFSNQIIDNEIVIKEPKKKYNKNQVLFLLLSIFNLSSSIYIQAFPLILVLIISIIKQLNKREVICNNDKIFYLNFYFYSTAIYFYYLFISNLGDLYKRKPTYALFPLILIIALYSLLSFIIKKEYKIKKAMIKDFERLKKIDKESCSICLRNFNYDENKNKKYFVKISEEENIHRTICNHYFHEKCIFNWRKYGSVCPICKTPLEILDYYFFFDDTPCIYQPDWI